MANYDLSNLAHLYILGSIVTAQTFAAKYGFEGGAHNIYCIHNFNKICGMVGKGKTLFVMPDYHSISQYHPILRYATSQGFLIKFVMEI